MTNQISRIEAVYTIAATVIGAGILALPTSMAFSGFVPGVIVLIIMGVLSVVTALYIVEVSLKTSTHYYMPGLAEYYLGKPGLFIMFASILIFVYGALTGYLSAGGQLIHELSDGSIPVWLGTSLYFLISSAIVYIGLRMTGFVSIILFSIMIILILAIAGLSFPYINPQLAISTNWSGMYSVFGVTLFAYAGHVVIPSLAHGMKQDKKGLIYATMLGFGGSMIIYIIWSMIFTMVVPRGSPADMVAAEKTVTLYQAQYHGQPATIPLGHLIGGSIMAIGSLFAILSTFTSYLGFGISMTDSWIDIFRYFRVNMRRWVAVLLAVVVPLILSLTNPAGFVGAITIAGIYGGGLFAGLLPPILVVMARKRQKNTTETFTVPGGVSLAVITFLFFASGVILKTYQVL